MSLRVPSYQEYERCSTPSQRLTTPRYDRNDAGDVEFSYVIDVSDFRPDEIQITQNGSSVSVNASTSKTINSSEENSSCSRSEKKEYHKTITLPPNSDLSKKLQTNYENGKLVLRIPVLSTSYSSIYPLSASNFLLSSSPRDRSSHLEFFPEAKKTNKHSEVIHLGLDFPRESIKINVSGEVVTVYATQDQTDVHGCHSTRQYSSEHKFPTNVDLDKIQADWNHGDLIISAPFK